MANFFNAARTATDLRRQLNSLVSTPDETLILIIGEDEAAEEAAGYAKRICESSESNSGFYKFVNFLTVPDGEIISNQLETLKNLTGWNIDQLVQFTIVAISPFNNNISYVVSGERFLRGKGSLDVAILQAIKND